MTTDTRPIRPGEEIDAARLRVFLEARNFNGEELVVEQFPAGSSNLTYLIKLDEDEFVLRRPPFGNTVTTAHDMRREFDVLSKLSAVYQPAPTPLLFCDDETVIGSEFYIMERRRGLIIRGKMAETAALAIGSKPPAVASGVFSFDTIPDSKASTTPPATVGATDRTAPRPSTLENSADFRLRVCHSFILNLADLHAFDYKAAGLADLGIPDGYVRRQHHGWSKRYFAAKTHEVPDLEKTIAWLNERLPPESGTALVHNDYKFDNIMLDPDDLTKITAVLDWEMVTIGDPLMDLGTTLGYWMSADAGSELLNMPFNPRVLMENISRQELVEMYAGATGRDVSNILYYYVFGTFKIAVIAQQIYVRYVNGFTKDERFANFDRFVEALGRIAINAIKRKSIG